MLGHAAYQAESTGQGQQVTRISCPCKGTGQARKHRERACKLREIKTTVSPLNLLRCAWEEPLPLGPQAGSPALRWRVLSCHQRMTPKGEAIVRASRPHCLREAAEERCRLASPAPLSLRQGGNREGEPLCEGEEGAGQGRALTLRRGRQSVPPLLTSLKKGQKGHFPREVK